MTGDVMSRLDLLEYWCSLATDIHHFRTTGREPAALGRVYRAGDIPFEDDSLTGLLDFWIGDRYG
jgi:hypothetical protein